MTKYYNCNTIIVSFNIIVCMRKVLSLSLPTTTVRQIRILAKKRGYHSVSSYVRHLFKADEDLISETELLKTARQARQEYRAGKSIKAKSLADLV